MAHFSVDVVVERSRHDSPAFGHPSVPRLGFFFEIIQKLELRFALVIGHHEHILVGSGPAHVSHTGAPDVILVRGLEQHAALGHRGRFASH
jgi:hypothetical protein